LIPHVVDEIAYQTRRNLAQPLADIVPFTREDQQAIRAGATQQRVSQRERAAERLAAAHGAQQHHPPRASSQRSQRPDPDRPGLLTRYQDTRRAQAISQEAKGLPFLQAAPMQTLVPQAATSSDAELQQARDVDRDLHGLTTNALLKDVTPELQGWAQAVRSAITEGTTAARFALDPRQRDKAFGIRRQLGDYARMARLVGALTPTLSLTYRKFAQSLDEVAAVILVTMGEALANAGLSGGRFLLQVPYTELQVRRDVAVAALRNLIGSAQETYGQNEYHRGLHAYRPLFKKLEDLGQGELRTLLVESQLAQIMDEMIHRPAHGRPEGLRALGATAQLDVPVSADSW
jgi:hypothetical protein